MPSVNVIELCTDASVQENGMLSGSHIWVDLVFDNGRSITIRADERDMYHDKASTLSIFAYDGDDDQGPTQTVRI